MDFDSDILAFFTDRVDSSATPNKVLCAYSGLGKVLDAAVVYSATPGDTATAREKDWVIAALLASQDPDGYVGFIKREAGNARELFRGWVIHDGAYICEALINSYTRFGHQPSLQAAKRFIDLVMENWRYAPSTPGACSPIGLPEACFSLCEATGGRKSLDFAANTPMDGRFIAMASVRKWRQQLYPMRREASDSPEAKSSSKVHTYRLFARLRDQLRLYRLELDPALLEMSDYVCSRLTARENGGMFITGCAGRCEGWVEDQDGRGHVGEACSVVYEIGWLSDMIEIKNDLRYGDVMERAILNHMFAAQNCSDGRSRYFTCLSVPRNYDKGAHCCEGNTRRFWATLPGHVFYPFPSGLAVNLFTTARVDTLIEGKPVLVEMETDYPISGDVLIRLTPQREMTFAVRLRKPRWAARFDVSVNGAPAPCANLPGAVEIIRSWKPGDTLSIHAFPWSGVGWLAGVIPRREPP